LISFIWLLDSKIKSNSNLQLFTANWIQRLIFLTFEIDVIITKTHTLIYIFNLKWNAEHNKLGQLSNVVEQLLHNIGFALLLHQFHNAILVLHWFYIDFTAQWILHWFYTTFTRNRNHICVVIIVHRRLCRSRRRCICEYEWQRYVTTVDY